MNGKSTTPSRIDYCRMNSPLGWILMGASAETGASHLSALTGLWFEGQKYEAIPDEKWVLNTDNMLLKKAVIQMQEYFAAERTTFELPFQLSGTEFQQSVWQKLMEIPSGETITYGELAMQLNKPTAVRAAAAAVGKNPASVIVPCHRVIGANGSLTGYAGGLHRKQHLLSLEKTSKMPRYLEA